MVKRKGLAKTTASTSTSPTNYVELSVLTVSFTHPLCRLWGGFLSLPQGHGSERGGNENSHEGTGDISECEIGFLDSLSLLEHKGDDMLFSSVGNGSFKTL